MDHGEATDTPVSKPLIYSGVPTDQALTADAHTSVPDGSSTPPPHDPVAVIRAFQASAAENAVATAVPASASSSTPTSAATAQGDSSPSAVRSFTLDRQADRDGDSETTTHVYSRSWDFAPPSTVVISADSDAVTPSNTAPESIVGTFTLTALLFLDKERLEEEHDRGVRALEKLGIKSPIQHVQDTLASDPTAPQAGVSVLTVTPLQCGSLLYELLTGNSERDARAVLEIPQMQAIQKSKPVNEPLSKFARIAAVSSDRSKLPTVSRMREVALINSGDAQFCGFVSGELRYKVAEVTSDIPL